MARLHVSALACLALASLAIAQPEPVNLLSNPSFEGATYTCVREPEMLPGNLFSCSADLAQGGVLVQEIDVPVGWTFHYSRGHVSPYSGDYILAQPEVRLVDRTYPARVAEGGKALKVYATWHNYAVRLSQALRLDGAGMVQGCISFHFWLSETDQGYAPNGNPLSEFREGGQVCVAVIAEDGVVQECGFAADEYRELCTPSLVTRGGTIVYQVTAGQSKACRNNDVYLDKAALWFAPAASGYAYWAGVPVTQTEPITLAVPPTPTETISPPLTTQPTLTPRPSPTPSPSPTPTPAPRAMIEVTPLSPLVRDVGWFGYLVRPGEPASLPVLHPPTPTPVSPQKQPRRVGLPTGKFVLVGGVFLAVAVVYLLRDRVEVFGRLFKQ